MEIVRKHFPEVLPDNEEIYFAHLEGVLSSVDELCCLQITKHADNYHFRIAPSCPEYNQLILKEMLAFHNLYKIRLILSKSIKTSGSIDFEINIE